MRKCKISSCILACAFGLNCSESEVFAALLDESPADVESISKKLGKDRTSVYRALQSLSSRGLVSKECRILRGGGYKYLYKPEVSMRDVAGKIAERLQEIEKMGV